MPLPFLFLGEVGAQFWGALEGPARAPVGRGVGLKSLEKEAATRVTLDLRSIPALGLRILRTGLCKIGPRGLTFPLLGIEVPRGLSRLKPVLHLTLWARGPWEGWVSPEGATSQTGLGPIRWGAKCADVRFCRPGLELGRKGGKEGKPHEGGE